MGILLLGGLAAPDASPVTMLLIAVPMYALYEVSIWIIVLLEKSWRRDAERVLVSTMSYDRDASDPPAVRDAFAGRRSRSLFANVLFAVSLFAVWGRPDADRRHRRARQGRRRSTCRTYPPALARLVLRLHFDNIYHDTAYIAHHRADPRVADRLHVPARDSGAACRPLRAVKIDHIPLHATVVGRRATRPTSARASSASSAKRGWLDPQARTRRRRVDVRRQARLGAARRSGRAHRLRHHRHGDDDLLGARLLRLDHDVCPAAPTTIPQTGAVFKLDEFRYRIDPIQTKTRDRLSADRLRLGRARDRPVRRDRAR